MSKLKNNNPQKHGGFNPYGIDKLSNIKPGVKIGFLKFWVAGAAFFVTFTTFQLDILDLFFLLYLIMVLATEFIVNKVIVWMHNDRTPTLKYLPHHVNRKSLWSLLATMGYVFVMILGSYYLIEGMLSIGVPSFGMLLFGFDFVGVDPITFGLVYYVIDLIYLLIRRLI